MPDDEETMVRQRLSRLFDPGTPGAGPPPRPGPSTPTPVRPWPQGSMSTRAVHPDVLPSGSVAADDPLPHLRPDDEGATSAGGVERDVPLPPASRLPGPGAFDPGRRGVRALAVVAAVVVLGAGLWAWRSRPHAESVRPLSTVAAPAVPDASPVGSGAAGSGELVVAVAGKVRRPGLVRVPAGSRVADAVEAAGGALPGVDMALLNPARKLTDGELILVGVA
ncbi:MAG: SLBB domain-containing protein, partial [Micromonospora sp.]